MRMTILLSVCVSLAAAIAQEPLKQSPFVAISPSAGASDTLVFSTPMPQFEARDLNGRLWRSSDLRGKVTVVQIWGTYCLPCRREHPELQNFVSRLAAASNVQVLTFSVDTDPSRTMSYLNDKGYRFPTIVDAGLEQKLFPHEGGIPQTYVINSRGQRTQAPQSWTLGRTLLEAQKLATVATR